VLAFSQAWSKLHQNPPLKAVSRPQGRPVPLYSTTQGDLVRWVGSSCVISLFIPSRFLILTLVRMAGPLHSTTRSSHTNKLEERGRTAVALPCKADVPHRTASHRMTEYP
jgi:hypothetical protein